MNIHTGIVLKHFAPKKQVCTLLDQRLGRITGTVMHERLSPGTVMQYRIKSQQRWRMIEQLEIMYMPFSMARSDMLFLHFLLEMSYNFTGEGAGPSRLYDVLLYVFDHQLDDRQKRRLLCMVLALIDIFPEEAKETGAFFYSLMHKPLQDIVTMEIDANIEKNIARWLYQCVRLHGQEFKTIHFLNEIE